MLQSRPRRPTRVGEQRFGFFPKFSTPVENTVENRALPDTLAQNLYILSVSVGAKVSKRPIFGPATAMNDNLPMKMRFSARRKSHFRSFFRS